jgi:hypothetical protein
MRATRRGPRRRLVARMQRSVAPVQRLIARMQRRVARIARPVVCPQRLGNRGKHPVARVQCPASPVRRAVLFGNASSSMDDAPLRTCNAMASPATARCTAATRRCARAAPRPGPATPLEMAAASCETGATPRRRETARRGTRKGGACAGTSCQVSGPGSGERPASRLFLPFRPAPALGGGRRRVCRWFQRFSMAARNRPWEPPNNSGAPRVYKRRRLWAGELRPPPRLPWGSLKTESP